MIETNRFAKPLARLAVAVSALLGLFATMPAMAATEVVPMERLHVHDVIFLPTVRSQFEAKFTKPKTWQVAANSQIYVEFQHSHELLPHRSWMQIILNDKVIKHIPLTKENVSGTKLTLPMPVALLKDFNTLTFRVEQHYADKCEDPLDKSLWTQVLPASKLIFNYTPVVPKVDLSSYPYPIIDPLTYSPAQVHYVVSKQASPQELQAMAFINAHLAQEAQDHELKTRVTFDNASGADNEHLVYVGKAGSLPPALAQTTLGDYALSGGQWINRRTGQALGESQGVVLFFQAPGSKEHTILIVSGNSDQAVTRAAQYLTIRPKLAELLGGTAEVPDSWSASWGRSNKPPRYVETQTRTFRELGFPIQEVQKINAPPITYHVPIVGDFRKEGSRLFLDLVYSYSPDLNPTFSSLELRMNDISIANIPLTNPQGEQLKRASIPISNELIKTRNNLVAQFHLMPDKHGWCVDNYIDNAWGKILDDSQFRVEGGVGPRLPDVGLLNNTMYPYSTDDALSKLHIVIPKDPSAEQLNAMLGFVTRLGRVTLADTDLRFSLGQDANAGDKHLAVFRFASDPLKLPGSARLIWQAGGNALMKLFNLPEPNNKISMQMAELGRGANIEQYLNGNQVISVFTASNASGFAAIGNLFETDKTFENLASGFVQQLSQLNPDLNAVGETKYHLEKTKQGGNWWSNLVYWLKSLPWFSIIAGMVALFVFMLILPLILRRILKK